MSCIVKVPITICITLEMYINVYQEGITKKLIHAFVSSRLIWTMVTLCCMGLTLAYWISYSVYKILQHGFSEGPRSMNISHQFLLNYTGFQCVAIEYKILLLTFRALNNIGPQYIRDLLNIYTPPRNLRSIDKHVCTKFKDENCW